MMDDLISRKVLMEGRVENDPVRIAAMCAPVAFDKEKAIEKLKDQYNYSRKVSENDNDYFEYWDGRTDSYKDAIEIVEKGGIE